MALDKKSSVLRRVCDWLYISRDVSVVVVFYNFGSLNFTDF